MFSSSTSRAMCIALMMLSVQTPLLAQLGVPTQISFQGILTDSGGNGISDTKSVMFSIYFDEEGGTAKWSETQSVVVSEGMFNTFLGTVNPLPDSIFAGQILWLGVKVESDDEMTPRQRLVSVPYSFSSGQSLCIPSVWYLDEDDDMFGVSESTAVLCNAPSGYVGAAGDCDDDNSSVNPGATEVCDGIDNDCDAGVDEGFDTTWYQDLDGDQYGNPFVSLENCGELPGYVQNDLDCDDTTEDINPEALEECDGVDNDCNDVVDDGNPGGGAACDGDDADLCQNGITFCVSPALACIDDENVVEVCDGQDNDCDGEVDEGC